MEKLSRTELLSIPPFIQQQKSRQKEQSQKNVEIFSIPNVSIVTNI